MAINFLTLTAIGVAFFVRIPMDSPEDIFVRGLRCCTEAALVFYLVYVFAVYCVGKEPEMEKK